MSAASPRRGHLTLSAFGRLVAIAGPKQVLDAARERLPPEYRPATGIPEREWFYTSDDRGQWSVRAADQVIATGGDLSQSIVNGLSDLELWVAEHAHDRVFIHAGVVVLDGRALIVPGHSMYGKTTLILALVQAGATYFSDEYAVFDTEGRIHPYRRRPSIRGPVPEGINLDAFSDSGFSDETASLSVAALVRFDIDQGWNVRRTSVPEGIVGLIGHAVAARRRPIEVLDSLTLASGGADFLTGTRGDSAPAVEHLLELLSSKS